MSQRMPSHCWAMLDMVSITALPETRLKGVQLEDVRPGRKVGVASTGENCSTKLKVGRRVILQHRRRYLG